MWESPTLSSIIFIIDFEQDKKVINTCNRSLKYISNFETTNKPFVPEICVNTSKTKIILGDYYN